MQVAQPFQQQQQQPETTVQQEVFVDQVSFFANFQGKTDFWPHF